MLVYLVAEEFPQGFGLTAFSPFLSLQLVLPEPVRAGLLRAAPDRGHAGVQAGAAGRRRHRQLHHPAHRRSRHVRLVNVR